ncbi:thioredoxin family protein, partial [Paraglaciecola arctica]|uniref:thioredoxin family protein n=1 Tax=Paraglaciecola arctica TaxID=1128911 RepID=UPI001C06ACD5
LGLFISAGYGYQTINSMGYGNGAVQSTSQSVAHPTFVKVSNLEEFNQALADANAQGKSVMLYLYADWCVACKEFEKYTFSDNQVIAALSGSVLMQIDLTDNTAENIDFQEHFSVLGLPTILFFDFQGQEISTARVTGFMRAEPFAQHVNSLFAK